MGPSQSDAGPEIGHEMGKPEHKQAASPTLQVKQPIAQKEVGPLQRHSLGKSSLGSPKPTRGRPKKSAGFVDKAVLESLPEPKDVQLRVAPPSVVESFDIGELIIRLCCV